MRLITPMLRHRDSIAIIKLAAPIWLSGAAAMSSSVINTLLTAQYYPQFYEYIAGFMPIYLLLIGLVESLRVPLTMTAAKSHTILVQYWIAIAILAVSCFIIGLCLNFKANLFLPTSLLQSQQKQYIHFCHMMLMAMLPAAALGFQIAKLNGQTKRHLSLLYTGMQFGLTLLFTIYLLKCVSHPIYAWPIAISITSALLLFCLYFRRNPHELSGCQTLHGDFKFVIQNACPVLVTYSIFSGSSFILFILFKHYLPAQLAGFSFATRIQTILLLPAASIAVAVSILQTHYQSFAHTIAKQGLKLILIMYSCIILLCYSLGAKILCNFHLPHSIATVVELYYRLLLPSYLGLAFIIYVCVLLDYSGLAIISTFISACIASFEVTIIFLALKNSASFSIVCVMLAACNIFFALLIAFTRPFKQKYVWKLI